MRNVFLLMLMLCLCLFDFLARAENSQAKSVKICIDFEKLADGEIILPVKIKEGDNISFVSMRLNYPADSLKLSAYNCGTYLGKELIFNSQPNDSADKAISKQIAENKQKGCDSVIFIVSEQPGSIYVSLKRLMAVPIAGTGDGVLFSLKLIKDANAPVFKTSLVSLTDVKMKKLMPDLKEVPVEVY